jgi:hypothetical protein
MKLTPRERRIAERMAPGVLCREGFLAPDRRPLGEILAADASAVAALGTTHGELAAHLRAACEAARAALGREVPLAGGRLRAVFREAMGAIPCPWGDGRRLPKGEVEVTDPATGRRLLFTPLSVHLIAEHGFYQGRGSRYRVEPAEAARLFGLDRRER